MMKVYIWPIIGITFKENCPDVRNTKAVDVVNSLIDYGTNVTIYDPWANVEEVMIKDQANMKVKNLINQLPPEQKEVVVLRHYAEMSFKEIAKMTGVSINTALGRMRYALINLRKLIEAKAISL